MVLETGSSNIISLRNVSFQYAASAGVYNVSFDVHKGEFVLLIGRTGSGKTTLMRLISLELHPGSGEIGLMDLRSSRLKRRQFPRWRRQLGIVYQDLRLLNDRCVLDNVKLVAAFESRLPGKPVARAREALSRVRLSHKSRRLPNCLSAGEQQRVAIARALVNEPFVMLADEPTSNLDLETAREVVEILGEINRSGTAVLAATHQPELFSALKPRVIHIDHGRLLES